MNNPQTITPETVNPTKPAAACPNCGTEILPAYNYCPSCGQDTNPKLISVGAIAKDVTENYFTVDSKILRSLTPLLFKPGFLTEEFMRGRRARYILPFRMYLTVSLLAFLVLAINKPSRTIYQTEEITAEELEEIKSELVVPGTNHGATAGEAEIAEAFWDTFFNSTLPKLFFVMVPFYALILAALYRKPRRYYVEHVIFSLHFHSFAFIVLLLYLLVSSFLLARQVFINQLLSTALLVFTLVYLFIALKRVYRQSYGKTTLKFGLLLGSYTVTFLICLFVALFFFYQNFSA